MKLHKLAKPITLHNGDVLEIACKQGECVFSLPSYDSTMTGIFMHDTEQRRLAPESLTVTRADGTVERIEFAEEQS